MHNLTVPGVELPQQVMKLTHGLDLCSLCSLHHTSAGLSAGREVVSSWLAYAIATAKSAGKAMQDVNDHCLGLTSDSGLQAMQCLMCCACAGRLCTDSPRAGGAQPGGRGNCRGRGTAGRRHDAGLQDCPPVRGQAQGPVLRHAHWLFCIRLCQCWGLCAVHIGVPNTWARISCSNCPNLA